MATICCNYVSSRIDYNKQEPTLLPIKTSSVTSGTYVNDGIFGPVIQEHIVAIGTTELAS